MIVEPVIDHSSMVVVWLAAIAVVGSLVTSVVAPMVMAAMQNKHRRSEKEEDWARQDEVARRALEATNAAAASVAVIDSKLNAIHTLGNAEKTAAIERELDGVKTQLVMLKEILSLKQASGQETSTPSDSESAIKSLEKKVEVLEADLKERARQTTIAEAQLRVAAGLPEDKSVPVEPVVVLPPAPDVPIGKM